MHGGSGSTDNEIQEAVSNGVVKMNIDTGECVKRGETWQGVPKRGETLQEEIAHACIPITIHTRPPDGFSGSVSHASPLHLSYLSDTQWAYWDGLRAFEAKSRDYLQGQIGNPEGSEKPNKKYYDPRKWVREAEKAMVKR